MNDEPLVGYTVKETAANLRVHEETVRRWIRAGLPALNVGTRMRPDYRIKPAVLEAWLADRSESEPE
jgi:excisionase family DNA binding protein